MTKKITVSDGETLKLAANDAVRVIAESTENASKTIANAAESATKLLAAAAESATKLLASNASEALKVTNATYSGDHDILVVLKSKMEDLKVDIKDLKDNTTKRVDVLEATKLNIQDSYAVLYKSGVEKIQLDHETRVRDNEKNITRILTYGSMIVVVGGIIEAIVLHLSK